MGTPTPIATWATRALRALPTILLLAILAWSLSVAWSVSYAEHQASARWVLGAPNLLVIWSILFAGYPESTAWNILYGIFVPLSMVTLLALAVRPALRAPALVSWANVPWLLAVVAAILMAAIPIFSHDYRIVSTVVVTTTTSGLIVAILATAALRRPFGYRRRIAQIALVTAILVLAAGLSMTGFSIAQPPAFSTWTWSPFVLAWPVSLVLLLLALRDRPTGDTRFNRLLIVAAIAIVIAAATASIILQVEFAAREAAQGYSGPLARKIWSAVQFPILPLAIAALAAIHALIADTQLQRFARRTAKAAAAITLLLPTIALVISDLGEGDLDRRIYIAIIVITLLPLAGAIAATAAPRPASQPH